VLEERRSEVLRALVEEHIRTGEPVSSRAVLAVTGINVSAATIRNDLAALEKEGYVVQPHTSAGRLPTARAYRYYVDHLRPARLAAANRHRITDFFSSMHSELGKLLKATSELLSEITHYPAVVVGPGVSEETTRAIHLVPTGAQTALLVLVTDAGRVGQEICRFDHPVDPEDLEEVERLLIRLITGERLDPGGITADARREAAGQLYGVFERAWEAVGRASRASAEVYVGGTPQMTNVWEDLSTVHRVLEVLEREAMLFTVLARAPGTTIQFATEIPGGPEVDIAVVSATYDVAGAPAGKLGVIGPMRMDYRTAITAVETVGQRLGDQIGS
jgi:heat-inducible transcriptional repressor